MQPMPSLGLPQNGTLKLSGVQFSRTYLDETRIALRM
jgi:hypothetical protein